MATILIVDDHDENRNYLTTLLGYRGHRLLQADNGRLAVGLVETEHPDLIIADILMPGMDGFEFIRRVRANPAVAATPVIFCTATYLEHESQILAHDCGVRHVLIKPVEPDEVFRVVDRALTASSESLKPPSADFTERHLELVSNKLLEKVADLESTNQRLEGVLAYLRTVHSELTRAYDATLEGWVRAIDLRDHETAGHTQRVTSLSVELATSMGFSGERLVALRRGALLHDIGKLAIPDHILQKAGPLDDAETAVMRKHPEYARQMLEPIDFLRPALHIPCFHHEKWDGTGYPHGLKENHIPLEARIFAVVDVWDALRSERPYRASSPAENVLLHISDESGRHFDPDVVSAFISLVGVPPREN